MSTRKIPVELYTDGNVVDLDVYRLIRECQNKYSPIYFEALLADILSAIEEIKEDKDDD